MVQTQYLFRVSVHAAAALVLFVASRADAVLGQNDPSFGAGGAVTSAGGAGYGIASTPDGRSVVVSGGFVSRYRANGSLDATFGSGGRASLPLTGRAVALAPDGRVLVGGSGCGTGGCGFAAARYAANGVLDATFGVDGVSVVPFPGLAVAAYAMSLQPDGGILLAGSVTADSAAYDFALARLLANGAPDPQFGNGGRVVSDLGAADDVARGIVALPQGGCVAAGVSGGDFALARYDVRGALVTSWGQAGGVTRTDFAGGVDRAWSVALDGVGRLVAGGNASVGAGKSELAVARYTADGLPDESFGGGGKVAVDLGTPSGVAESIVVLPGGDIAAAGSASDDPHETASFAVVFLTSGGVLDGGYGASGVVTTSLFPGGGGIQEARGAAYAAGGLVTAGYAMSSTSGTAATALARYVVASATRGDADGDQAVGAGDVFYLMNYLFASGPPPHADCDVNGDRKVDILDIFYLVNHVFAGGPAPIA